MRNTFIGLIVLLASLFGLAITKSGKQEAERVKRMSQPSNDTPDAASYFQIRLVREEAGDDTEPMEHGLNAISGKNGNQQTEILHVLKTPSMDQSAIASAYVDTDPVLGSPHVIVEFTAAGRVLFGDVTRANVDKRLAILIDGRISSAVRVLEPILGGKMQVTGDFMIDEAKEIASVLSGPR